MTPDTEPIRILREQGGEIEVTGSIDAFASDVLRRADFRFEPTLRSVWIRLPFDLGRAGENQHATWAAEMLTAARYRVDLSLKRWITSRTVSSSAWTSRAMTGTALPPAEASSIIARRNRTELVLPRRTICCSLCPSYSDSPRTLTGAAIPPPPAGRKVISNQHNEQPGEPFGSQLC